MTTTINNKAQVSLPSDTEVRVTRDFKAPRTLVWQAHTEPTLFQRWIGGYPGWVDAGVRNGCPPRRQVSLGVALG